MPTLRVNNRTHTPLHIWIFEHLLSQPGGGQTSTPGVMPSSWRIVGGIFYLPQGYENWWVVSRGPTVYHSYLRRLESLPLQILLQSFSYLKTLRFDHVTSRTKSDAQPTEPTWRSSVIMASTLMSQKILQELSSTIMQITPSVLVEKTWQLISSFSCFNTWKQNQFYDICFTRFPNRSVADVRYFLY